MSWQRWKLGICFCTFTNLFKEKKNLLYGNLNLLVDDNVFISSLLVEDRVIIFWIIDSSRIDLIYSFISFSKIKNVFFFFLNYSIII
jgi:hypothetical protein